MERQDRHHDVARSRIAESSHTRGRGEGRLESYLSNDGNGLPRSFCPLDLILYYGHGGQAVLDVGRCRVLENGQRCQPHIETTMHANTGIYMGPGPTGGAYSQVDDGVGQEARKT